MRKITVYPAPHTEVRIHASDEMIKDFKECAKLAAEFDCDGKDCNKCSWSEVKIGNTCLCKLEGVHRAIIGG